MYQEAVAKLQAEMQAKKDNAYVQVVGDFLLQYLGKQQSAAEKVMDKDKTIAKSLDAMRKEAEKKKNGNCAVLTDQQGFAIVLEYFGISEKGNQMTASAAAVPDFNVDLEDLLK